MIHETMFEYNFSWFWNGDGKFYEQFVNNWIKLGDFTFVPFKVI